MLTLFFKKNIYLLIIVSLIFTGARGVFSIEKAQAMTGGEAVGKAIGAGVACFLESKIDNFLAELDSTAPAQGLIIAAEYFYAVPEAQVSTPSKDSADAIMKSKDCVRDVVVKIIIDWIVDETVQWIQGGGEPKFVTNWKGFLKDAANVGIGEVVRQTKLAPLCSPFKLNFQIIGYNIRGFSQQISCTLDDIVGNIENFYNDFNSGSWIGYNELWNLNNNFYGLTLVTYNQALIKMMQEQGAAKNEVLAGKGFLSVKRCVGGKSQEDFCDNQCSHLAGEEQNDCFNNCMELEMSEKELCEASGGKMEITTPGDVLGETVAKAVTSDTEWAANVKSWMAALINAVINRLIKEGLSLMHGSNEPRSAGYGDYDPYNEYGLNNKTKQNYISYIVSEYKKIIEDREIVLAYKRQSLEDAESLLDILNKIKQANCQFSNFDANAEIVKTQTDINRLEGEISDINSLLDEAENLFLELQNLLDQSSNQLSNEQIKELEIKYSDFISRHSNIISEVYSGSGQQKAKEESENIKSRLSDAQTKLNSCSP